MDLDPHGSAFLCFILLMYKFLVLWLENLSRIWIRISKYCGSGIFIPDPDLPIPDLGSRIQKRQQKRGEKKIVISFFCSHKFHKIENYFIFVMSKEKIWANFQMIIELFTQKVSKLSNMGLGSGKTLFRIPDPWVKKAQDPGSGSATRGSALR